VRHAGPDAAFDQLGHEARDDLLANPVRRQNLARIRALLHVPAVIDTRNDASPDTRAPTFPCRHCGAPMIIIDILLRSQPIRAPPTSQGNA